MFCNSVCFLSGDRPNACTSTRKVVRKLGDISGRKFLSNRHGLPNVRNISLLTVRNSKMTVRFLRNQTSNSFENTPNSANSSCFLRIHVVIAVLFVSSFYWFGMSVRCAQMVQKINLSSCSFYNLKVKPAKPWYLQFSELDLSFFSMIF
jgi:hypothetical protein